MTKWITINGSHVKVDENGNVITGGGGNIPNKNSADPTKHEPPEYVKKMKLGEKQSSAYRQWQAELSKPPDERYKAKQNAQVRQLFKDAEHNAEARSTMKKLLSGNPAGVRELSKMYPNIEPDKLAGDESPNIRFITESLAFDRASVRTIDANGRLQISRTNISKANVNGYYGREIPRSEELGLEPNKLYRLWRHPDELRKAAKTFNNIPVLSKHIPDFPTDPPNEFRVGVTHSNAEFDGTYLTVGMSIWDNSAIAGIESGEQRELSASYKYVADMTPGVTPDGEPYDGVMRDIFGNHEALVPDGRAGPDVLVADSLPPELNHMRKHKVAAIRATLKPLLAQDADLEAEVRKALLALDEAEKEDEKENKPADDEDVDEKDKKKTADDEEDEEDKDKKKTAEDEDDEEDDKVSKTAMDSAIRLAADSATKKAAENFRKIREAEQVVRPLIGDVVAMDSAEDVYRTALEQSGVDIAGVPPSAYPAMVKMAISQKENSRPVIAQDSASVSEFEKAFPTAGKLKRG